MEAEHVEDEALTMPELIEEFNEHNPGNEGRRGVENLCRLARALGYKDRNYFGQLDHDCSIGDLIEFFEDNSGAIEAVKEWISGVESPEWKANLLSTLPEKDLEEEEDRILDSNKNMGFDG